MKLVHVQSLELLDRMCKEVSSSNEEQRKKSGVYFSIFSSIERGNFEFTFGIVKANPDLVWSRDHDSRSIFSLAVLHRQAKIFSLIYGLAVKKSMTSWIHKNRNNILHMAGMTGDSTLLNRIPGAALQMQRELQWFKEVESIVPMRFKEFLNNDHLTPRELFTKNHKDLMKEGEKWMKGTATSCTVVGALTVTIMFAAAFTVPGGNVQDTGYPIFLNEKLFMLFIISDALSLFSSSTSVLMFLGILTSRYAEDDFLESLPRKMIIGLSTLFFSIAAMMMAFSAALLIMLHGQSWIVIPVVCLATIPITLFVLMQSPLLADMFISTYGPGIFDKKMERWI
ncbi:ankyrin repeat-containing protein NPR4-like [Corylus avellana]|uniref:ankyrin repeat-containing protein NPR4-like n=1 Tax=Corylus avellana TaxID=13451 RepID=UPI00286A7623|nr:ankyrin repeat-containing protein NPR4-like [Corylus avellana]